MRTLLPDCYHFIAALIAAAALPSSCLNICVYTLSVMAGVAWPRRFETVATSTPAAINWLACVCRSAWNVISPMPTLLANFAH
jgi:hypothetical protein